MHKISQREYKQKGKGGGESKKRKKRKLKLEHQEGERRGYKQQQRDQKGETGQ